jgi:hypothetical protein
MRSKKREGVMLPDDDVDLFEMANLYPATTGLPMTVWVSPRGGARHDARIKVNMTHGPTMNIGNAAVVGIRPSPHIIHGHLPASDMIAVERWIRLNETALLDHWDGKTDAVQLGARLVRI